MSSDAQSLPPPSAIAAAHHTVVRLPTTVELTTVATPLTVEALSRWARIWNIAKPILIIAVILGAGASTGFGISALTHSFSLHLEAWRGIVATVVGSVALASGLGIGGFYIYKQRQAAKSDLVDVRVKFTETIVTITDAPQPTAAIAAPLVITPKEDVTQSLPTAAATVMPPVIAPRVNVPQPPAIAEEGEKTSEFVGLWREIEGEVEQIQKQVANADTPAALIEAYQAFCQMEDRVLESSLGRQPWESAKHAILVAILRKGLEGAIKSQDRDELEWAFNSVTNYFDSIGEEMRVTRQQIFELMEADPSNIEKLARDNKAAQAYFDKRALEAHEELHDLIVQVQTKINAIHTQEGTEVSQHVQKRIDDIQKFASEVTTADQLGKLEALLTGVQEDIKRLSDALGVHAAAWRRSTEELQKKLQALRLVASEITSLQAAAKSEAAEKALEQATGAKRSKQISERVKFESALLDQWKQQVELSKQQLATLKEARRMVDEVPAVLSNATGDGMIAFSTAIAEQKAKLQKMSEQILSEAAKRELHAEIAELEKLEGALQGVSHALATSQNNFSTKPAKPSVAALGTLIQSTKDAIAEMNRAVQSAPKPFQGALAVACKKTIGEVEEMRKHLVAVSQYLTEFDKRLAAAVADPVQSAAEIISIEIEMQKMLTHLYAVPIASELLHAQIERLEKLVKGQEKISEAMQRSKSLIAALPSADSQQKFDADVAAAEKAFSEVEGALKEHPDLSSWSATIKAARDSLNKIKNAQKSAAGFAVRISDELKTINSLDPLRNSAQVAASAGEITKYLLWLGSLVPILPRMKFFHEMLAHQFTEAMARYRAAYQPVINQFDENLRKLTGQNPSKTPPAEFARLRKQMEADLKILSDSKPIEILGYHDTIHAEGEARQKLFDQIVKERSHYNYKQGILNKITPLIRPPSPTSHEKHSIEIPYRLIVLPHFESQLEKYNKEHHLQEGSGEATQIRAAHVFVKKDHKADLTLKDTELKRYDALLEGRHAGGLRTEFHDNLADRARQIRMVLAKQMAVLSVSATQQSSPKKNKPTRADIKKIFQQLQTDAKLSAEVMNDPQFKELTLAFFAEEFAKSANLQGVRNLLATDPLLKPGDLNPDAIKKQLVPAQQEFNDALVAAYVADLCEKQLRDNWEGVEHSAHYNAVLTAMRIAETVGVWGTLRKEMTDVNFPELLKTMQQQLPALLLEANVPVAKQLSQQIPNKGNVPNSIKEFGNSEQEVIKRLKVFPDMLLGEDDKLKPEVRKAFESLKVKKPDSQALDKLQHVLQQLRTAAKQGEAFLKEWHTTVETMKEKIDIHALANLFVEPAYLVYAQSLAAITTEDIHTVLQAAHLDDYLQSLQASNALPSGLSPQALNTVSKVFQRCPQWVLLMRDLMDVGAKAAGKGSVEAIAINKASPQLTQCAGYGAALTNTWKLLHELAGSA